MTLTSQLGDWRSKVCTLDLNQAVNTYDVATATGDVVIDPRQCSWYVPIVVGGALTSVSVQTNQTTVCIMLTAVEGAVANLTAQASLSPANVKPFQLRSGQKLQFTIAGGAGGAGTQIILELIYKPVGAGSGVL